MARQGFTQKLVEVSSDDAKWFEETYPRKGAWTWFVQSALAALRQLGPENPDELIREAVKESMKQAEG